jgi:cell division protein FtsL
MVAYFHGNLAVDERSQRNRKTSIQQQRRQVTRKKAVIPPQEKLLYLITVLACVIVAIVIISRYAQIYELNTEIKKIQNEMRQLERDNSILKSEISRLGGLEQMQQTGEDQGMHMVSDDQMIKIRMTQDEQLDTPHEMASR